MTILFAVIAPNIHTLPCPQVPLSSQKSTIAKAGKS